MTEKTLWIDEHVPYVADILNRYNVGDFSKSRNVTIIKGCSVGATTCLTDTLRKDDNPSGLSDETKSQILEEFAGKFKIESMPAEFAEVVEDHFWELVE